MRSLTVAVLLALALLSPAADGRHGRGAPSPVALFMPAANNVSTNWANAGLQASGGIPNRTTQCGSTVTPIGGTSDDYTHIQNAINACTVGQYVQLGAGATSSLTGSISGTTLTVSTGGTGLAAGMLLSDGKNGSGLVPNTYVLSGSGTTWTVNNTQTLASSTLTAVMPFKVFLADLAITIPNGISLRGADTCPGNISNYPAGVCGTQIVVYDGLQAYQNGGPLCGTSVAAATACPNGGQPVILMAPINPDYNWGWNACANPGGTVGTGCGATPLTADAAQGQTTISVSSTANFSVGMWVLIDEASGAGWQVDPDTANTGFGHVWAAPEWAAGGFSVANGRVLWSKGETLPGTGGFSWDFPSGSYPYQTSSVGCYPYNYCDRPTSELHKISAIGSGTLTFDDPLTIAYRVSGPNTITASISGTTLTVTAGSANVAIGLLLQSNGSTALTPGTYVTAGSGSSWTVSNSQTVGSESMYVGAHGAQVYGPVYPNHSGTAPAVAFTSGAGLENLSVLRGPNGIIEMALCTGCWIKNVEAGEFYNGGITVSYSSRSELNTIWVHHCWDSVNSGGEYPISLDGASTEILITNWITNYAGKGMVGRAGGAGSVISYGYQDDTMYDKWSGIGSYFVDMGVNASHYSGPHHVLFEGNWGDNLDSDSTHGSSQWITFFRNQGTGLRTAFVDPSCNLTVNDFTGAGYTGSTCTSNATGPQRGAGPMAYSYQFAYVGNVLGLTGKTTTGNGWTYQGDWNGNRMWAPGWWNFGTGGNDPNMTAGNGNTFLFRSGNYDYVNGAINLWQTGYSQTLPNSLYLTSAPSFFGAGASCTYTWPWVTPTGSTPIQSNSCSGPGLPAQARWAAGTPFVQP